MKKSTLGTSTIAIAFFMLSVTFCNGQEKKESQKNTIDLVQARKEIVKKVKQFEDDVNNADSLAVANHYATDGTWGAIKGKDNLISAWGKTSRSLATKNLKVRFTTNTVSSDGEFIFETGLFEFVEKDNSVKRQGKYLLVWKKEAGEWKVYRDLDL